MRGTSKKRGGTLTETKGLLRLAPRLRQTKLIKKHKKVSPRDNAPYQPLREEVVKPREGLNMGVRKVRQRRRNTFTDLANPRGDGSAVEELALSCKLKSCIMK